MIKSYDEEQMKDLIEESRSVKLTRKILSKGQHLLSYIKN